MSLQAELVSVLTTEFPSPVKVVHGPFELVLYPDGAPIAESCMAVLAMTETEWVVRTSALDAAAQNAAQQDNEETWLLGDVIEFFIQRNDGRDDYYEFHATPECKRLQLHLPHYQTFHDVPFESKFCDCQLHVESRFQGQIWLSELRIPFDSVDIQPGDAFRFAVCRYNYLLDGSCERSSYPALTEPYGFHNPPLWMKAQS